MSVQGIRGNKGSNENWPIQGWKRKGAGVSAGFHKDSVGNQPDSYFGKKAKKQVQKREGLLFAEQIFTVSGGIIAD